MRYNSSTSNSVDSPRDQGHGLFFLLSLVFVLIVAGYLASVQQNFQHDLSRHLAEKQASTKQLIDTAVGGAIISTRLLSLSLAGDPEIAYYLKIASEEGSREDDLLAESLKQGLWSHISSMWDNLEGEIGYHEINFFTAPDLSLFYSAAGHSDTHHMGFDTGRTCNIVQQTKNSKGQISGFEVCRECAAIRSAIPSRKLSTDGDAPALNGVVEVSISLRQVLQQINAHSEELDGMSLFLDTASLGRIIDKEKLRSTSKPGIAVTQSYLDYTTDSARTELLTRELNKTLSDKNTPHIVRLSQHTFGVTFIPVNDYSVGTNTRTAPVGEIMAWWDVSDMLESLETTRRDTVFAAISVFIVLEILLYLGLREAHNGLNWLIGEKTRQIREINERHEHAQEIARLGNWDWEIDSNRIYWSDEIYRIFGLEPGSFQPTYDAFMESVHPDDRDRLQEAVTRSLTEGMPYNEVHRVLLPDGRCRIVREQGKVLKDTSGKPKSMNGTVLDITELKETEKNLARQLRYEEGLTAMSETLLADKDNCINEGLAHLLTACDTSRVYMFENFTDETGDLCARYTYEVCSPGVMPQKNNKEYMIFSYQDGAIYEHLSKGRPIAGSPEKLTPREQEILGKQGVQSVLLIPLRSGQNWYGFLGFDEVRYQRPWETEEIVLLRAAAGIVESYKGSKRTAKALAESENRLRTLINATPDVICFKDGQGRWIEANSSITELFQLTDIEYRGKTDLELAEISSSINAERLTKCDCTDEAAWESAAMFRSEETAVKADGSTIVCDVLRIPLFHKNGGRKGLVILGRDITLRKNAESHLIEANRALELTVEESQADLDALGSVLRNGIDRLKETETELRESEELFRQIAENINDVFWIYNKSDNRPIYVNPAFQNIWGVPVSELFEKPSLWEDSILAEDREHAFEAFRQMGFDKPITVEYRIKRSDGSIRWIHDRAFPVDNPYKRARRVVGITSDITERKQAEYVRLAEARKQRDSLVREVHHRIKNHLQGLIGLLSEKIYESPGLSESLEVTISQIKSISLVHGIQGSRNDEMLGLSDLVQAIRKSIMQLTGVPIDLNVNTGQPIYLSTNSDEAVPLSLIINELLQNAAKHGLFDEPGSRIQMNLDNTNDGILLSISNKGNDMPAGFDLQSGSGLGTGLGLVMSLMPRNGAILSFSHKDGITSALLKLGAPLIVPQDERISLLDNA